MEGIGKILTSSFSHNSKRTTRILFLIVLPAVASFVVGFGVFSAWSWHFEAFGAVFEAFLLLPTNLWFRASFADAALRGVTVSILSVAIAIGLYLNVLSAGKNRQSRWLFFVFGLAPLLFNFMLACVIWKSILMGRPLGEVALPVIIDSRSIVLTIAYLGQHIPIAIVLLYGRLTALEERDFEYWRTVDSSPWLRLRLVGIPMVRKRAVAAALLSFVLVVIDPAPVRIIAGGDAANIGTFVTERFLSNDYAAAAAASVWGLLLILAAVVSALLIPEATGSRVVRSGGRQG